MKWFVAVLLLVAVFAGIAVWRGRQVGELARRGVPVTGTVVGKFRSGSTAAAGRRGRRLAFTYTGPDGNSYRRAASVGADEWANYDEGSPIELVCLPDDPGVSAPAALVRLAREALTKRP